MKTSQLSEAFEAFQLKPVTINTKLQITTEQGVGIMSYRGVLVDNDDYMVYIGFNPEHITTAIKWEDIATIELLDMEQEFNNVELSNIEPESGAKN